MQIGPLARETMNFLTKKESRFFHSLHNATKTR